MVPRVSVVIPVYRTEAYLRACVDSVLAQDFEDLEVILADDGSPDGCPGICDEYARRDPRVRALHQPNAGVSAARNAGLAAAAGEYVLFLDSDDRWNGRAGLRRVVDAARAGDADWALFGSYDDMPGRGLTERAEHRLLREEGLLTPEDYYERFLPAGNIHEAVYTKLLRREFLLRNDLWFREGLPACEDTQWLFRVLRASRRIRVADEPLYIYRYGRADSASGRAGLRGVAGYLEVIEEALRRDPMDRLAAYERAHCAYLWFVALSGWAALPRRDRRTLAPRFRRAGRVASCGVCPGARRACRLYRRLGMGPTAAALGLYGWLARRGLIFGRREAVR